MRRITRPTALGFLLACLFFSGSAVPGESPPQGQAVKPVPPVVHGYCYADAKTTVYFTAAFSSAPVGGPGGSTHQEVVRKGGDTLTAWREAFDAYLKTKYGHAGFIQCALADSLPKAESQRRALLDMSRRNNASFPIKIVFIETGWSYSASASAS